MKPKIASNAFPFWCMLFTAIIVHIHGFEREIIALSRLRLRWALISSRSSLERTCGFTSRSTYSKPFTYLSQDNDAAVGTTISVNRLFQALPYHYQGLRLPYRSCSCVFEILNHHIVFTLCTERVYTSSFAEQLHISFWRSLSHVHSWEMMYMRRMLTLD